MKKFQIIILAAGTGSRMGNFTKKKPKCLLEINNESILSRQIRVIKKCNINKIFIVGGYLVSLLKKFKLKIITNNDYRASNMVWSLFKAKKYLNSKTIISYGDIIYHRKILKKLTKNKSDIAIAVDQNYKKYWKKRFKNPFRDLETLKIEKNKLIEIGKKTNSYKNIHGQYIGLIKLSNLGCKIFKKAFKELNLRIDKIQGKTIKKASFTDFLQEMIMSGVKITPVFFKDPWVEIDTIKDIKNPITIKRLSKIN
tara:strand:- start:56 stop:817 length:762 start_codon:yes stop_codon:yes gene_type:complete